MTNDTFWVDEEFNAVCAEYSEKITKAEGELKKYIDYLNALINEKDVEGQTADSLEGFSNVVAQTIQSRLDDIGSRYKIITNNFSENIINQDDITWI